MTMLSLMDVAHRFGILQLEQQFRMKRSCSQSGDGTPIRRSARQAGQQPEDLPPPPSQAPTTDQIMRMFEEKRNQDLMEFLRSMRAMVGQNNNNVARSKLSNFQRTKPPNFGQVVDPIEADDWLRTIEKKLDIARCDEADKVPFATHYLEGPATIWWDNTKATWPCGEEITWERFKEAFRKYHIPTGIMKVKQREFLDLTQGGISVAEYLNKFNNLARYSTHDVSTEERKIDRFLGGPNHTLRCQLCMLDFPDFQTLVNKAFIAEWEHKVGYDDRKRKFEPKKDNKEQTAQKPRTWQPSTSVYKPTWNNSNNTNKAVSQNKTFGK